jgi:eukaryotic-like serine/threonine-protein kinase
MIGKTVSHYRILDKLGGGGMGVVYRAEDTRLHRPVALKFLPDASDDPVARERFMREARAASSLNHPHICTVHEVEEHEGRPFIVMELLEGRPLGDVIAAGPLATDRIVDIAIQMAEGLGVAHERGIVHRDIKPANVSVSERGQVKILDFGLAKPWSGGRRDGDTIADTPSWGETLTTPGITMGTLSYGRSDLFSFGAVLYEMATGQQAFPATGAALAFDSILNSSPMAPDRANPGLHPELARVIMRALEKDRSLRYQSADEVLADLDRLRRELESGRTQDSRDADPGVGALAVLPFENAAADPDAEYLCEGITEGLINSLSQLPQLRVMARSTVFRFKGRDLDPLAAGRELAVGAVLVGRVTQRGGSLLITAELIDSRSGFQIWGDRFDRRIDDLFAVQEEITREISRKLRLKLAGGDAARVTPRPPANPGAQQAYLTGRYHWNRWTPEGFQKAIEHYERAIALDPRYALAYAGLSDAYSLLGLYALLPPVEAFPHAKQAALKALALDDSLAEAHTSLGTARFFHEWDWRAAQGDFQRGLELNPASVSGRHIHSTALSAMGRHREALAEARAALELDPLSLVTILNLGWVHFNNRDWDGARAQCRAAFALDPEFPRAHELMGLASAHAGELEEAVNEARRVANAHDGTPRSLAVCGYLFALAGRKEEARETVAGLRALAARVYVPALSVAFVSAALDKKDTAFEWLERAFDEQDCLLVWLRVDPRLDNLRTDTRFYDLVQRVGLRLWQ